jgi:hypothetical protein
LAVGVPVITTKGNTMGRFKQINVVGGLIYRRKFRTYLEEVFKTTTENQKRWEANEEIDC